MTDSPFRSERDSMGVLDVPANAYYGANTRRAELNFPISHLRFSRSFIRAIGQVKQCAAEVNLDLEALDAELLRCHHRQRPNESSTASSTTPSWSTSSRPAPALQPT